MNHLEARFSRSADLFRASIASLAAFLLSTGPMQAQVSTDSSRQSQPQTATVATPAVATAEQLAALHKQIEEYEKNNRVFKWGLSIGWRNLLGDENSLYRNAVLQAGSDTVRAEKIDRGALVLSGALVAFPWKLPIERGAKVPRKAHLGFIANIAFATFGEDNITTFNQSIEGGLGVAYRMSTDFALAVTAERVFSRRLRSHIRNNKPLPPLPAGEERDFSRENEQYFYDDNLSAWSFKFLYFFR